MRLMLSKDYLRHCMMIYGYIWNNVVYFQNRSYIKLSVLKVNIIKLFDERGMLPFHLIHNINDAIHLILLLHQVAVIEEARRAGAGLCHTDHDRFTDLLELWVYANS